MLLGGERNLVLLAGLISVTIGISGFSITSALVGVGFWVGSIWALVKMGKTDPILFNIYRRYLKYKSYYAAQGGAHCKDISAHWRNR